MRRPGGPSATTELALLALCLCATAVSPLTNRLDFLNERLPIPESSRFVESEYVDSGVGVSYGVDKRLSYLAGDYAAAAQRFEEAVAKFGYKSEIWVYLARSHFYNKEPDRAREALERAAVKMPDLRGKLWQPLIEGLLVVIREHANRLQVKVDYYSQNRDDFFSLFRLYRFLEARPEAIAVIEAVDAREARLMEQAAMSSASKSRHYRRNASEWGQIAAAMREELRRAGLPSPAKKKRPPGTAPGVAEADLLESTRALQLKIDYYRAETSDYEKLLTNYLQLGRSKEAKQVIAALDREIARVKVKVAEVSDVQEELKHQDLTNELASLRLRLVEKLDAARAP